MRQLSAVSQPKRKRGTPLWKRPSVRPLAFSALMGIVAALLTYAVKTGLADLAAMRLERAALSTSANSGLVLKDVFVEGRDNTPIADLRAVVNLELGQPILDIDPNVVRQRVEALPWVATASVERQLPDIIHIRLNEHRPIAMWQHDATFSLINKEGEVILTGGDDIKVFAHLPLVVGEGAPQYTAEILSILQSEPELNKSVKAAVRVSDRRWDIAMDNGVSIRLPEDNPEQAWAQLARYNKDDKLFNQKLTSIDMRFPNRMLIKMDNAETIRKPLMGQDT